MKLVKNTDYNKDLKEVSELEIFREATYKCMLPVVPAVGVVAPNIAPTCDLFVEQLVNNKLTSKIKISFSNLITNLLTINTFNNIKVLIIINYKLI